LISLHNYFIIHSIKYFFLNKNNQTIQGGQKKFQEGQITENIIENHYFLKFREARAPLYTPGSAPDYKGIARVSYELSFAKTIFNPQIHVSTRIIDCIKESNEIKYYDMPCGVSNIYPHRIRGESIFNPYRIRICGLTVESE
jgi:hypothetical protein